MTKCMIRKKDTVVILSGRNRGHKGEVLRVFPEKGSVLVAKAGIVTRHVKPRQGEPGGIQKREAPISLAKVMLVCPKCEQGVRAKSDKLATGERVRVCRKCNEVIL